MSCLIEDWGFRPELLEYVKTHHRGTHRIHVTKEYHPERELFIQKAEEAFDRFGIERNGIVVNLSIQKPEEGEGYHRDYPHRHLPTIIHYLDPSDVPTPLHIFEGDEIQEVVPRPGMAVFVPDQVLHGVPRHKGTRDRIQIIAVAK